MMKYDAERDANQLAAPLLAWQRLGFLRGFAGMRTDLGPKQPMVLPSAAFREACEHGIENPPPDNDEELRARQSYIEEMNRLLLDFQADSVREHYRKAFLGWAVDMAMGWYLVLIAGLAWYYLGIYHPLMMAVLIFIPVKAVIIHLYVRRKIAHAMKAFSASSSDVKLPWQQQDAYPVS